LNIEKSGRSLRRNEFASGFLDLIVALRAMKNEMNTNLFERIDLIWQE